MILSHRQRSRIVRLLLLAVLSMQFIPLSHAMHGPADKAPGHTTHPEQTEHGRDCHSHNYGAHDEHGSDHDHDSVSMVCDCLLCQMTKAPLLTAVLFLGTGSISGTQVWHPLQQHLPAAATDFLPPNRAPPLLHG